MLRQLGIDQVYKIQFFSFHSFWFNMELIFNSSLIKYSIKKKLSEKELKKISPNKNHKKKYFPWRNTPAKKISEIILPKIFLPEEIFKKINHFHYK